MRELDWWSIGAQSLKIPFYQWRTLLLCVASASAAAIIAGAVFAGCMALVPEEPLSWLLERIPPYSFAFLAFLWFVVFQWCWMTALWHNSLRHCLTYFLRHDFWKFAALLLLVLMGDGLVWMAKISAQDLIGAYTGTGSSNGSATIGLALGAAGLHAWLFARLMIWPAYVVAKRDFVAPTKIWRATEGLFWDFIFLVMRIQIPVAIIGIVLIVLSMIFWRSASAAMLISILLTIFAAAATSAASLLAYFEVIGKRDPATLPAN